MTQDPERSFAQWMKLLVDRICEREEINRSEVAKSLGVHVHSISTAAYRGEIGLDLIRTIAERARATPEERDQAEEAWLKTRATRPRDDALRLSLRRTELLLERIMDLEDFLEEKGLVKEFLKRQARKEPAPPPRRPARHIGS